MNPLILVVDDEPDVEMLFRAHFRRDLRTRRTKSRRALIAVRGVKPRRVGVIFTEIRMSAIGT
jgi:DNA-binding NtrC family response regulator